MCTLSVITRDHSYLIAMNRDEKITRGAGLPPEVHEFEGARAIYPSDGSGGTWLATSEYGVTWALLNWNDAAGIGVPVLQARSRGRVIPALIHLSSTSDVQHALDVSLVQGMMPFRLVGVFPSEREIWEWRWDSTQLGFRIHGWESQHWFSSSLSDERAESFRGAACRGAHQEPDAGSARWLRRLHASHAGGPGPFSVCVHREDVKTLAYSEVMVTSGLVRMAHFTGSPCTMAAIQAIEIARRQARIEHFSDAVVA